MFSNTVIYSILAAIITILVCFIISTLLPGIERKYIHARIQQRIGPIVIAPGIMAPIKFMFKENVKVESPVPGLYKVLPIICFIVVMCLLIALTPQALSVRMPFPDQIKGAVHNNATRSFIEDISSRRSLRMITYGSFPLYLALFAPVTQARSISLRKLLHISKFMGHSCLQYQEPLQLLYSSLDT